MMDIVFFWVSTAWLAIALHARYMREISTHQIAFYLFWFFTIPLGLVMQNIEDKNIWEATND